MQNINSILKEKSRTSVFVAHRLRTIYDSDQILVLKDGQVVEMGSHRELLDLEGVYAELWKGKLLSRTVVNNANWSSPGIIAGRAARGSSGVVQTVKNNYYCLQNIFKINTKAFMKQSVD